MPHLILDIELPDETHKWVLALPPQGRIAFDTALPSVALAVAAAVPDSAATGVALFPQSDLHALITTEDILAVQEQIQVDEDREIILATGFTGR